MKFAVNSEQMKQIDDYTTEVIRIPQLVLMERAAMEVVEVIKKRITKRDRILVICGPGNNGGDGVAAGRILYLQGYQVALLFIADNRIITLNHQMGELSLFSSGMRAQVEIAINLGIPMENNNKLHEYNVIIDAVFGVGLSRPITGTYEELIRSINKRNWQADSPIMNDNKLYRKSNSLINNNTIVFSVDIPSGISADTGNILNIAVKADETITFGYMKQGLLMYPGAEYAGKITLVDIGFPEVALQKVYPNTFYYGPEDLEGIPKRKPYSNKGSYGKVLVIAGSQGMSGAAYLSAKAAYRTGAGLVKILTHPDNRIILQSLLPEALLVSYSSIGSNDLSIDSSKKELSIEIKEALDWASVVVIGPGIGRSKEAAILLQQVRKHTFAPLLLDADAINLLAEELDMEGVINSKDRCDRLSQLLPPDTILTPHLLELSRLIGLSVDTIRENLIDTAKQCSYNNKLIYTLKDARTIVAKENNIYINISGNHGMATGGSGDVLTGIIAALIAQGLQPYEATCLAVYIHGLAGDLAADGKGTYAMMAGDMIDEIGKIMEQ